MTILIKPEPESDHQLDKLTTQAFILGVRFAYKWVTNENLKDDHRLMDAAKKFIHETVATD